MAAVNFEDISVAWGGGRDAHDEAWSKWWRAVFQDLAVSGDASKLYFLYDPIADETSVTSSGRKGGPAILVFDVNSRKFVREIALNTRENREGQLKYFFLTNAQTNTFVVLTQLQSSLQLWHLQLSPDGMSVQSGLNHVFGPIPVGDDWIVVNREDRPEVVLMTGPGLTVWRLNAAAPQQQPIDSYQVPDGDMRRYYDAVIWQGVIYLLAARPDDAFDFTHVHTLQLEGRQPMRAVQTQADPQAGFPPNRKQTGVDVFQGQLFLAGGEMENQMTGQVARLQDVWALNLSNMMWQRKGQLQMNLPLIEPRLSIQKPSGTVIVWGDCDIPQGCLAPPTHVHMLRTHLQHAQPVDSPPSYNMAQTMPAYPGQLQMNLPLIEPRLSIQKPSGMVIVWGDCDIPQGCLAPPTHVHMLRTRLQQAQPMDAPPSYNMAQTMPAYPGQLQMNLPLIEPRLSIQKPSGTVIVWGDCDIPQGCLAPPTHVHMLRTRLQHAQPMDAPPSYNTAQSMPAYPGYHHPGMPSALHALDMLHAAHLSTMGASMDAPALYTMAQSIPVYPGAAGGGGQMQPPQYGGPTAPPYGQGQPPQTPQYGGQGGMGQPQYGQGPPQYGQGQQQPYGQGPPMEQKPPYGQQYGGQGAPYGQGQSQYGQGVVGQPQYGQGSMGQQPQYGQGGMGQPQYGQGAMGQPQYGQGQQPYGQGYGQQPTGTYGLNPQEGYQEYPQQQGEHAYYPEEQGQGGGKNKDCVIA